MKSLVLPRPRALKTLNITIQDPTEDDFHAAPVFVPDAEPAIPQIYWKVASGDLPVFSHPVKSVNYLASICWYGKNNDAVNRMFSMNMKKNGVSLYTTGTNATAGQYNSRSAYFYDVEVDDELEVALWSAVAGVQDYRWTGFQVTTTRIFLDGDTFKPFTFTVAIHPIYVGGDNPGGTDNLGSRIHLGPSNLAFSLGVSGEISILQSDPTYGVFQAGYGDSANANSAFSLLNSATIGPRCFRNRTITSIAYRSYGDID